MLIFLCIVLIAVSVNNLHAYFLSTNKDFAKMYGCKTFIATTMSNQPAVAHRGWSIPRSRHALPSTMEKLTFLCKNTCF